MLINRFVFVILSAGVLTSCVAPTQDAATVGDEDYVYEFAKEYRIGVGDTLQVNVYGHQDVTTSVRVRPDGKITMPIAGDISVGGQVPEEVATTITEVLSKYIREPIVTVTVADVSSTDYVTRIRVTGAVQNPQAVEFRNGITVMDAVLEAGGPNEFASTSRTRVYRKGANPISVRLDLILKGRDMESNVRLKPGDVVTIPERLF